MNRREVINKCLTDYCVVSQPVGRCVSQGIEYAYDKGFQDALDLACEYIKGHSREDKTFLADEGDLDELRVEMYKFLLQ